MCICIYIVKVATQNNKNWKKLKELFPCLYFVRGTTLNRVHILEEPKYIKIVCTYNCATLHYYYCYYFSFFILFYFSFEWQTDWELGPIWNANLWSLSKQLLAIIGSLHLTVAFRFSENNKLV